MKDAKAKLEQVKRDKTECNKSFDADIARLEKEIADSESTYSIGDRFEHEDGSKWILVVGCGCNNHGMQGFMLVDLSNGCWYDGEHYVNNNERISQDEFNALDSMKDFTRYWDARKGERC